MSSSLPEFFGYFFLLIHHCSFSLPKAAFYSDRRPDENGRLTSTSQSWPPQPSRTRRSSANRPNFNAANQTECVFQTPIRADHEGRYIRLTTGQAPILCDVIPFGSTLHNDRDACRFAAFVSLLYAAFSNSVQCVSTSFSLNNSPVLSIARMMLKSFLPVATIAIFFRLESPCITRS